MSDPIELVKAVRALARASRLIERASDDLSLADYRVLAQISGGEERASRLAHNLALGKPAVSATVDSLGRRGLIVRGVVEGDARATSLALTDEGQALFERTEARMTRQLEQLAERTDEPDALIRSIASLADAIDVALAERRERTAKADA